MMRHANGFGLVEIMLALLLGLVMSLALTQIFATTKSTYLSQTSSASLQEDARFILAKMMQEVRLAGMFGCLGRVEDKSRGGQFSRAFHAPVEWNAQQRSLTLNTAAIDADRSWHTWEVHTDCASSATAWTRGGAPKPAEGEIALAVHRQIYRFNPEREELALNGQPLLSNVRAFSVLFGVASGVNAKGIARYTAQPDPAMIRSVRLTMTLYDPADRAQEYTFNVVAAIRNRLG
jgi:type IV pilus assembly protein PilW